MVHCGQWSKGGRHNEKPLRRGESAALSNGSVIEIGTVEMMFILPDGALKIAKVFLKRAGLIQVEDNEVSDEPIIASAIPPPLPTPAAPTLPALNNAAPLPFNVQQQQPYAFQNQQQQQMYYGQPNGPFQGVQIAPAPPNWSRPETPLGALTKVYKHSPNYNGTMIMHGDDVDLSLDSNQHIKPAFSYAQLIAQSILDSPDEKLTLAGIYDFIMKNWAYYRYQPAGGWQARLTSCL